MFLVVKYTILKLEKTWVQEMVLQGCQAEIPAKKLKRGHKKKFLAEFWLILPKTGRKGAAENLYIVY